MEPTLNQANIVLVALNHRPDIVSKEWLNQNNILKEAPLNFIHHQNFSLIETTNFSINVVQQLMTVAARRADQNILNHLQTIANRYIEVLPHVSYNAIGLNSSWMVSPTDSNLLKSTLVAKPERFIKAFHDEAHYDVGGIVYYQYEAFQVQLTITPHPNQINANFNYHSDITNSDQLSERISHFTEAIGHARNIIKRLLGD